MSQSRADIYRSRFARQKKPVRSSVGTSDGFCCKEETDRVDYGLGEALGAGARTGWRGTVGKRFGSAGAVSELEGGLPSGTGWMIVADGLTPAEPAVPVRSARDILGVMKNKTSFVFLSIALRLKRFPKNGIFESPGVRF